MVEGKNEAHTKYISCLLSIIVEFTLLARVWYRFLCHRCDGKGVLITFAGC